MVAAVRRHQSLRTVARRFGVSISTVVYWVQRAKGQRLDRVDWTDRSRAPHHTQRTDDELEEQVLRLRRQLRKDSDLGAYGADSIQQALREQGVPDTPSVRTIHPLLPQGRCAFGPPTPYVREAADQLWASLSRASPLLISPQSPRTWRSRKSAGDCPELARACKAPGVATTWPSGNFMVESSK